MKKDVLYTIIGAVVAVAITWALAASHGPYQPPLPGPAATAETTPTGTASNAPPAPAANDPIVMRVNGEPVTEHEFNGFISTMPEQMQAMLASPMGRRQAAEQITRMKLLEQEAKRLGADSDPEMSTRMRVGHTNLAVEYAIRKLASNPSDADLRAAYEKEKGRFEVLDISHILIAYQGGSVPSRTGQPLPLPQAMQKAQTLLAQIRAGADFAAVARRESDDQGSAANGGRLGPVPRGQLPPDVDAVVSRLQPGQMSDAVRSAFGVHIFKLNSRQMQSLEQVKPLLQQRIAQTTISNVVDKLQKNARVELDPKFFAPSTAPRPPQRRMPVR